jgi:hypothetical protein
MAKFMQDCNDGDATRGVNRREPNMDEDRRKRGGLDRNRVNLGQPHEVRYWMDELGVDEGTLREAVARVGTRADTVRAHLEALRSRRTRRPTPAARPARDNKN